MASTLAGSTRALLRQVEGLVQRADEVVPLPAAARGRRRDQQDRLRRLVVGPVEVERDPGVAVGRRDDLGPLVEQQAALARGLVERRGVVRRVEQPVAVEDVVGRELQGEPRRARLVAATGSGSSVRLRPAERAGQHHDRLPGVQHRPHARGAVQPLVDRELDALAVVVR